MYFYSNVFSELLARARQGDRRAQLEFREELERAMIPMVRQTLRSGVAGSVMARRILAEARRLDPDYQLAMIVNADAFIREVAENLCEEVAGRLEPRPVPSVPSAETVCATAY